MRLAQAYVAELEAEIERLTGLVKVAEAQEWRELQNARVEIERLKAALRRIADLPIPVAPDIARAALEGNFPTKKSCPECGQPMREGGYCDHIPF